MSNDMAAQIAAAVSALRRDELVVLPTRRWYMVCGAATSDDAWERIFAVKRRPPAKALMLGLATADDVIGAFELNPALTRLMRSELADDDLLLRVPWKASAPVVPGVGDPMALVGVLYGVMAAVVQQLGGPVVGSSANISGDPQDGGTSPAACLAEARAFAETTPEVTVVVDGGIAPACQHSTIVRQEGAGFVIERTGVVHERAIQLAAAH